MRQNEVLVKFREYSEMLTEIFNYISVNGSLDGLMEIRGYTESYMLDTFQDIGIAKLEEDVPKFRGYPKELGLMSKNDRFLLQDRYAIPVLAPNGVDMLSIIGYYPDSRKYITLPTPFFSRRVAWFNFYNAYQLSQQEGDWQYCCVAVEGIFDCLSLRALGIPCIATMGAEVSLEKAELLKFFKHVLAVPDADKAGRKGIEGRWNVPSNTVFLKLKGGLIELDDGSVRKVKDMDDFVLFYDDVSEILLDCLHSDRQIVTLEL